MRSFIQRHPNFLAFLFGLAVCFVLFAVVEGLFYLLLQQRLTANPPFVRSMEGLSEDHPLLGYRPKANTVKEAKKDRPGEVAYECTYTIDALNRRMTPVADDADRDRFALFFGGSFTFGEGVEDNETLPAAFARHAPAYRSYNYGYVGCGPQTMYMHLQRPEFKDEINEQSGVAVFTFINSHMSRVVGSMRVSTGWGRRLPYLSLNSNDTLTFNGIFEAGRPRLQSVYRLLAASPTLRYLNIDMPGCEAPQDFALTAAIFRESQRQLDALFPDAQLFVLFYPYGTYITEIAPRLNGSGVQILDYTTFFNSESMQQLPLTLADGHPTPTAHRIIGKKLAEDIQVITSPRDKAQAPA